ncbi:MAG: tetratricopeptide repeat protein [Nannocystis sp.]|nr:tetratricopeptide repeat protein [Nannocystis sp.]
MIVYVAESPSGRDTVTADTLLFGDGILGDAATLGSGVSPMVTRRVVEPGARLGRYLVIRTLGAGAMGVVVAAYDPKLDRKVALKLIKTPKGTETDLARKRLEREAQALAKLAHPNVVVVFDVDVHDDQLFVAMEFVEGGTLGAWMQQPRPWREVLSKFVEAGRGLAAAHAAGLVHRDFKPDNVMLGSDGRVRVMDFGLARPDDAPIQRDEIGSSTSALAIRMTQTGAVMGTPVYMAPEQYEGHADARSDQFGFCAALYEALHGQLPFSAASMIEQRDAVAAGRIDPAPRGATVPAWLRAVVLRGLAPEPERRWPDMAALLDALADDPALRRRRWGAALLITGLLAGGAASVVWATQQQAQVCKGFEARLAGVWDDTRRSEVRSAIEGTGLSYAADTAVRVEQRLDEYTTQWVAVRGEACEAHQRGEQSGELLDLRMRCLDERLQHVAVTVGVLSEANEEVVRKAVEAVVGLPSLDRCSDEQALQAELAPPDDPELARRVAAWDQQLIEAAALRRAGEYKRGLARATTVIDEAEAVDYEPLHARAWLLAGNLEDKMGRYVEAEALLERALASALALGIRAEAADAAAQLVHVVGYRQARHEAGRSWAKIAEPLARAAGTSEASAGYLNNLGTVAYSEGKYEQSRGYHERALATEEKALGPDHPDVAMSLNNLGVVAATEGKYEQARAYFERVLAIWEKALGPDHPNVASSLNNLGNVAKVAGKYEQAQAYYERALAIEEKALGPDHPDVAMSLNNLGVVVYSEGEYEQARAYFEHALAIMEKALGPDHPNVAALLTNLAEVAESQGNAEKTRAYYERALAIKAKALGPDHPNVANALTGLGEALTSLDTPAAAIPHLERALTLRTAHEGDPIEFAKTRFALARALWAAAPEAGRDRPRARSLAELAAAAYEADGDKSSEQLAEVREWLATHV